MSTDAVSSSRKKRVKITVASDKLSATMILSAPREDELPYTLDEIREALAAEGIVFGIKEDEIQRAVEGQITAAPITIAEGTKPDRGIPARLHYHFDTDQKLTPKEDEDGRIDYRDISFIQNIHEGETLVTKEPPQRGLPGKNIYGEEIQGPLGRDQHIKRGANTSISDDGLTLTASATGSIVFQRGKVSVSAVTTINGDLDFSVGNIDAAGSVKITGDIKTGFTVKVDGNLEVGGNVEDSQIEVKGNILCKGGFFGKEGSMRADNDIVVKYAEGQRLNAGNDIIVGGEIINCRVQAGDKIVVKGRRGKIIGGELRALVEIRAAVIGSEAFVPTLLHVGFDANLMKQYHEVLAEIKRINEDGCRVKTALYGLYRQQMDGKLSAEKQIALKKLQEFQSNMPSELEALDKKKAALEEELAQFKDARVIAEEKIYPGVKAYFGIVYREVEEERQRCKLQLEGQQVLVSALMKDE